MKEKKSEVMTIRVTKATKEKIELEAEKRDWSPSKLAEKILTSWVEQEQETEIKIHFHKNTINNINIGKEI